MPSDFRTTRWSVVLAAAEGEPGAEEALAWLCEAYWYPMYVYVRRRGHDSDDAKDLTQSFFLALLQPGFLDRIDPGLGRFRAFLLAALKNFMSKERVRVGALKRRADNPSFQASLDGAEELYGLEGGGDLDPEAVFERRWALTILERALQRLAEENEAAGKGDLYRRLEGYITGESDVPYAQIGAELSKSEGAVKLAVHRLRQQLGKILRDEVSHTVANPEQVDDEVRHLLRVAGG